MSELRNGDVVVLTIKDPEMLYKFNDDDMCEIIGVFDRYYNDKRYYIKRLSDDWTGYARKDELQLLSRPIAKNLLYPTIDFGIDFTVNKLEPYITCFKDRIEDIETQLEKKENNNMKILKIYKDRATQNINEKYEKLIKEARQNDTVAVILEETENRLNVLLDRDETNPIKLEIKDHTKYEKRTCEIVDQLYQEKDKEIVALNELIAEVEAQLEIREDYEDSRIAVFKQYGILDENEKIKTFTKTEKTRKTRK